MIMESNYKAFQELCKAHGCRCTPQRFAVYSYIKGNPTHPDVQQIWDQTRTSIPTITRESVFRILMELVDFGVILRMDKFTAARFDGGVSDHGHLICGSCGIVVDFDLPRESLLPEDMHGFTKCHTELRIIGLCASCQAVAGKKSQSVKQDKGTERR